MKHFQYIGPRATDLEYAAHILTFDDRWSVEYQRPSGIKCTFTSMQITDINVNNEYQELI